MTDHEQSMRARRWLDSLRQQIGILRSRALYDWVPFSQHLLRRFYRPFVHPGDLCFDIGAHVGNRTRAFLALGARVVSVEPQPSCVRVLHRRFSGHPRWQLCDQAIGATAGSATMRVCSLNPTVSTLSPSWQRDIQEFSRVQLDWDQTSEVGVTTLDHLIELYGMPAFCKLDVEDYELPALLGLSQALPALSFEFYPTTMNKAVACVDRLEELGSYRYTWSIAGTLQLATDDWLAPAEMRRWLADYRGVRSGDVYARRRR